MISFFFRLFRSMDRMLDFDSSDVGSSPSRGTIVIIFIFIPVFDMTYTFYEWFNSKLLIDGKAVPRFQLMLSGLGFPAGELYTDALYRTNSEVYFTLENLNSAYCQEMAYAQTENYHERIDLPINLLP